MSKGTMLQKEIAGLQRVADNLYRVNRSIIKLENTQIDPTEEKLRFINPRGIEVCDEEIIGFAKQPMGHLKNSIQRYGLVNPLVGRIKADGNVYLIEGHRRFKAISELIEEDGPCYDVASGKNISAKDMFESVLVRVYDENTTDEECFKLSFQEDKSKVHFGAGAEIRFVHHCVMMGTDDQAIMEMLGNTPEWLRETKHLIRQLEGDDAILNAVFTDKINRTAAKNLAQVEDWSERRAIFKEALAEAQLDCVAKIEKFKKSMQATSTRLDIAKSRKAVSVHMNDQESVEKYDDEIAELTEKANDLQEKIDTSVPVINPEALRKGSAKLVTTKTSKGRVPTHRVAPAERISTKWRKFFEVLSEKGRIGDVDVNQQLVDFTLELLQACTDKENDPEEFVLRWNDKF